MIFKSIFCFSLLYCHELQKTMGSGGVPQIGKEQYRLCKEPDEDHQDPAEPLCAVDGGVHKTGMAQTEDKEKPFCNKGAAKHGGPAGCL